MAGPVKVFVAVFLAAAALAACSSATDTGSGAGSTPHAGGTLTFALASDPTCADAQQVASNDSIYPARQLVDSLTDQDPKTGNIVPWLATSWSVNANATSFVFHLRHGATFSDGTPVDARAVKDNFDGIVKLGAKAQLGSSYLGGYRRTVVVDPYTARVEFATPNAQFLQATSTLSLGLLSESTLAKTPAQRCDSVIGSGPFTLDHFTHNVEVADVRRSGYAWGSPLRQHTGPARLDLLVFRVIPEQGVRTGSLRSGQVDGIGGVGPPDEPGLKSAGFTLQTRANPGIVFNLQANLSRPIVADAAVRQAITKAVDRQQVVDTVLSPDFKPATSTLSSSTLYYPELGPALATDVAGAKALLDADGWRPGADGIRTKAGQRLSLRVIWFSNFGPNQTALELIQQQLKAVGVDITLKEFSIAQGQSVQKAGDYDFSWGNLTRADPDILRTTFSTGGANNSRLRPGPLEQALGAQAAAADTTTRAKDAAGAQKLIVDNAYSIPVFELTTILGLSSKVHGVTFDASSRLQFYDAWKS